MSRVSPWFRGTRLSFRNNPLRHLPFAAVPQYRFGMPLRKHCSVNALGDYCSMKKVAQNALLLLPFGGLALPAFSQATPTASTEAPYQGFQLPTVGGSLQ